MVLMHQQLLLSVPQSNHSGGVGLLLLLLLLFTGYNNQTKLKINIATGRSIPATKNPTKPTMSGDNVDALLLSLFDRVEVNERHDKERLIGRLRLRGEGHIDVDHLVLGAIDDEQLVLAERIHGALLHRITRRRVQVVTDNTD